MSFYTRNYFWTAVYQVAFKFCQRIYFFVSPSMPSQIESIKMGGFIKFKCIEHINIEIKKTDDHGCSFTALSAAHKWKFMYQKCKLNQSIFTSGRKIPRSVTLYVCDCGFFLIFTCYLVCVYHLFCVLLQERKNEDIRKLNVNSEATCSLLVIFSEYVIKHTRRTQVRRKPKQKTNTHSTI